MLPIRTTLQLSRGSVTLRAWGADVADAHLIDLMTLTATLGTLRAEWEEFRATDIQQDIWAAFWRLVDAAVEPGSRMPRLSWGDRLIVLQALYDLNPLEEADENLGKLLALAEQTAAQMTRLNRQGLPTSPSTSS